MKTASVNAEKARIKPLEWNKAVNALVEKATSKNTNEHTVPVDLSVTLTALTGWLNTSVTEYTEGSYDAMSRRIAFLYPNNYTLTLGTGINPTIAVLDKEVSYSDPLPFECMDEEKWFHEYKANGWERIHDLTIEELEAFILLLAAEAGEPTLILPFEQKLYMLEDDPWWDENDADYNTFAKLLTIFTEEHQQAAAYAMGIGFIICDDDEYLSKYCELNRFLAMTTALEEEHGWYVNLDEHCAACSRGTKDTWDKENPDKTDAPEFLTWGQNSQNTHKPNGSLWAEVFVENSEEENFLRDLAVEYGIATDADTDEEDYEPTGSVIFGDY